MFKALSLFSLAGVILLAGASLAQAKQAPQLLSKLTVATEKRSGYDRDLFTHWIDADGNGCDTRQEVLGRQNSADRGNCRATTGRWFSAYDRQVFTISRSLDVDHFVPLAEAWDSGARRWSAARRTAFANDLYGYSLLAVSASSNRSKSDADPGEWLPPAKSFTCRYLARWVAVKYRWRLSVDSAERQAIRRSWSACPADELRVNKIAIAR